MKEKVILFSVILVIVLIIGGACSDSGSSSSGRKWSDLSDVEKANAKWAYEAQQAINNYKD